MYQEVLCGYLQRFGLLGHSVRIELTNIGLLVYVIFGAERNSTCTWIKNLSNFTRNGRLSRLKEHLGKFDTNHTQVETAYIHTYIYIYIYFRY